MTTFPLLTLNSGKSAVNLSPVKLKLDEEEFFTLHTKLTFLHNNEGMVKSARLLNIKRLLWEW